MASAQCLEPECTAGVQPRKPQIPQKTPQKWVTLPFFRWFMGPHPKATGQCQSSHPTRCLKPPANRQHLILYPSHPFQGAGAAWQAPVCEKAPGWAQTGRYSSWTGSWLQKSNSQACTCPSQVSLSLSPLPAPLCSLLLLMLSLSKGSHPLLSFQEIICSLFWGLLLAAAQVSHSFSADGVTVSKASTQFS